MGAFWGIAGMAVVTFAIRYLLLPLSGRLRLNGAWQNTLKYVPPAVLTAIIVPAALLPDSRHIQLSLHNPYLVGAVLTVVLGWFSRNMLVTILGGMAVFAGWQWLLSTGWL